MLLRVLLPRLAFAGPRGRRRRDSRVTHSVDITESSRQGVIGPPRPDGRVAVCLPGIYGNMVATRMGCWRAHRLHVPAFPEVLFKPDARLGATAELAPSVLWPNDASPCAGDHQPGEYSISRSSCGQSATSAVSR